MTIRAIIRNGCIEPLEPLLSDWVEGQELVVEPPNSAVSESEISDWAKEIEIAAGQLPREDHDLFRTALSEIERESKDAVRREWGLS